jgi:hypothetical protein
MSKYLITIEDVALLSGFDGNIDNDTINPFIFMAQRNDIKRILGNDLYTKIADDFEADTLAGDYLDIFTNYICIIQAYYTCAYYLRLGVAKVSQNGVYLVTPEKTEQLTDEERNKKAEMYEKLAVGLELEFVKYLDTLNLPERPAPSTINAKSNFNWMRPCRNK